MHKEETYLIRLSSNNPAKAISEKQHCMSPVLLFPCTDVPLYCTATLWVEKKTTDDKEAHGMVCYKAMYRAIGLQSATAELT